MARAPKPLAEARANLEASIPNIGSRYLAGVQRGDWAAGAGSDSSETNFATAMQRVISGKTRQSGVRKAGNDKWRTGAEEKGAPVIGERIRMNLDKWTTNFQPVYDAVVRATNQLPPRTLDPMSNIDNRAKPVVRAAVAAGRRGKR